MIGGGYSTDNRLFRKLQHPDRLIERFLLRAVSEVDIVIAMGTGAMNYFQKMGIRKMNIHIIPGGFDGNRFYPAEESPDIDLILIGRLTPIKRVDIFLQAILHIRGKRPDVTAVVVGDGPDRNSLEQMALELGIKQNVKFLGEQRQVEKWLRRSRIFVLTSDSEGLSQAMIQAMLCGLPAVVSNVGDLGDLVEESVNGHLVSHRNPKVFADKIIKLLNAPEKLLQFGTAARLSAERYGMENVVDIWNKVLLRVN
ncbi:MAG: glycosyltransferase [Nitrospirae bacterium]|nr:glycosyltransferase [Nitrospirota bacterium]